MRPKTPPPDSDELRADRVEDELPDDFARPNGERPELLSDAEALLDEPPREKADEPLLDDALLLESDLRPKRDASPPNRPPELPALLLVSFF